MNIIGFDLSTTHIGWCCVTDGVHTAHGETALRGEFSERMMQAHEVLERLCDDPACNTRMAIETPFVGKNAKTSLQLGLMRGLAWAVSMRHFGAVPIEITPAEAKLALTGTGKASKSDMMAFARLQTGIYMPEHAADAFGVALAAWGRLRAGVAGQVTEEVPVVTMLERVGSERC